MISGALIGQAGCILFHSKRDIKHKSFAFKWKTSTIHVIPGESLVDSVQHRSKMRLMIS